jgi:energy-coupling factor transporter ATP-binding protein EcfA2
MAIEVKSTKGAAKSNGVKVLVVGGSGVGKTNLFRSTGRTIIISAEGGDLTLNDVDVDSIRVKSLAELKEAYIYVSEHSKDYDTVGIDSITEIGELIVAELKKMPEYSEMKDGMKLWMKFSEIMLQIAKSFRDIDGLNVVILALPESIKNGFEEKIMPMIPAKKVQAKLGSLYDEVFLIRVNDDGEREFVCQPTADFDAKDRSGKLDPVEPYGKEDGLTPIFKKILGKGK